MGECNLFEASNIYPNLNDPQFRLNKIDEVKYYFIAKIKKKKRINE